MAQTRMPTGSYVKKLMRLPKEIVEILEQQAAKEDRSLNGQLVHVLRESLSEDQKQERREAVSA